MSHGPFGLAGAVCFAATVCIAGAAEAPVNERPIIARITATKTAIVLRRFRLMPGLNMFEINSCIVQLDGSRTMAVL